MSAYTEDHLVEQPAIQLMQDELGWEVVNCFGEWDGGTSAVGRDGKREVVLTDRLKPVLQRLNPDLPVEAIEGAVEDVEMLNFECWILNGRGRRRFLAESVVTGAWTAKAKAKRNFHGNHLFHDSVKVAESGETHSHFTLQDSVFRCIWIP